jgi:hypothetical protein
VVELVGPDPEGNSEEGLRRWAEERLSAVGLTVFDCHQINGQSLTEMRKAPRRGSKGARGIYAYEGGLAEFTVQCEQADYIREDLMNLPIMISDTRRNAMIFTSGNSYVGVRGTRISPRTRHKKGGVAHHAIRSNRQQAGQDVLDASLSFKSLPTPVDEMYAKLTERLDGYTVRYYLVHFDLKQREIRSEISTPGSVQPTDYMDRWNDRIWIPPFIIPEEVIDEDEGPIDFEIEPI